MGASRFLRLPVRAAQLHTDDSGDAVIMIDGWVVGLGAVQALYAADPWDGDFGVGCHLPPPLREHLEVRGLIITTAAGHSYGTDALGSLLQFLQFQAIIDD